MATGLEVPWDLTFLPDGRVLVTERSGRVRVIEDDHLREEPWATLGVEAVAESGLLGIAADPDFEENGYVYVLGTFVDTSLAGRLWRKVAGVFDETAGDAPWKDPPNDSRWASRAP